MSTTTISALDLVNYSQGIAQLNLGYLGISVAILGVLGGVFVYFNIKPLKDTLEKQEKVIEDLRKEAQNLLTLSATQSEEILEKFKAGQSKLFIDTFKQQEDKLRLEISNKVQEVEKDLLVKIEIISENKDIKLKEFILSESTNRLSVTEKDIISKMSLVKEDLIKKVSEINSITSSFKSSIKKIEEKVLELQVYKYGKEGQMGAIIYSIDLLKRAIDDYFELKNALEKFDPKQEENFSWKIKNRIQSLSKEIGDLILEDEYNLQISTQLDRLTNEKILEPIINDLRSKLN